MTTTQRLLDVLGLLQTGRRWTGSELSRRLGVTPRTVRRDVERLRELGYPIDGGLGAHGGYLLTAGTALPPLLLDDDEAVAVAIALRTVAVLGIFEDGEVGLRALAKLSRSLPSRLSQRVRTMDALAVGWDPAPTAVDAEVLARLSAAAAAGERLRMGYEDRRGSVTRRHVEPFRVVLQQRRWYLLAFDLDRDAARRFRVDRIVEPRPTGVAAQRSLRDDDIADLMRRIVLSSAPLIRADVTLDIPIDAATARLRDELGDGRLSAEGARTRWHSSQDTVAWTVLRLLRLDCAFEVHGPAELKEQVALVHRRTGGRALRPPVGQAVAP